MNCALKMSVTVRVEPKNKVYSNEANNHVSICVSFSIIQTLLSAEFLVYKAGIRLDREIWGMVDKLRTI